MIALKKSPDGASRIILYTLKPVTQRPHVRLHQFRFSFLSLFSIKSILQFYSSIILHYIDASVRIQWLEALHPCPSQFCSSALCHRRFTCSQIKTFCRIRASQMYIRCAFAIIIQRGCISFGVRTLAFAWRRGNHLQFSTKL